MSPDKQQKQDLLVIGELNMDLILDDVKSFPELGKEKIAGDLKLTLGSSSAIFAANSARLGLSVGFSGMVGDDDFGEMVLRQLGEYTIDTSWVTISQQYKTGLTAIIRHDGNRANVTYPGAMEPFSLADIPPEAFRQARHLHMSSIFLQPGVKNELFAIIERAKSVGMTVSVDTQWDPEEQWDLDFEKLLSHIDFFLPNEDEFLNIAGARTTDEAIKRFQPFLAGGAIIIKQGAKGATYVTADEVQPFPGHLNSHPVDTIGAGDSFNAGLIYRFLQGDPLPRCIHFANITGAVSTTASGGTAAIQNVDAVRDIATNQLSITD